jgi:hypothetical protein
MVGAKVAGEAFTLEKVVTVAFITLTIIGCELLGLCSNVRDKKHARIVNVACLVLPKIRAPDRTSLNTVAVLDRQNRS